MARIQALKQQRFIETQNAPTSSFQMEGGNDGVPKFHSLPTSKPVFKASSLLHNLHIQSFGHMGSSSLHAPTLHLPKIKMPSMKMPSLKMPKLKA